MSTKVFASALMIASGSAMAAPLLPGGSVSFPTYVVPGIPVAPFATLTTPFISGPGSNYSGTLTSFVFNNDPFNPGGLTFAYFVANDVDSDDALGAFTVNGYAGWLVDAGVDSAGAIPVPFEINRSASGGEITAMFGNLLPPILTSIAPGDSSGLVILRTNATDYGHSIGAVIDGSVVGNIDILAPIPTPGAGALLGLGTLAAFRRRR